MPIERYEADCRTLNIELLEQILALEREWQWLGVVSGGSGREY